MSEDAVIIRVNRPTYQRVIGLMMDLGIDDFNEFLDRILDLIVRIRAGEREIPLDLWGRVDHAEKT